MFSKVSKKFLVISGILIFQLVLVLSNCRDTPSNNDNSHQNDTILLTKHWEKAIPNQIVPEGLVSLKAKDCGMCHQEIYEEWKRSTHAVALQDLQFQVEWKKDGKIYVCLNCHIPLQNQQEFIVTGLIDGDYHKPVKKANPYFDEELQQESITCASCHIRDGNVIGTIGNTDAPHKTVKDIEFLSEKLCIGCHNVVDELNLVLVCSFETGDEWRNNWAIKAGKNCISCHMPETERAITTGYNKRVSHFHHFPGSGIPKFKGMETEGLNGLEIREDNFKDSYAVGEKLTYKLVLKNSYAGHSVPTGDPERFFMVHFQIQDSDDNILKEKYYRIGEEWQWYPKAKKLSDNNLKPLEEREFTFEYQILHQPSSRPPLGRKLFLTVRVSKHRMTKENAELSGLLENYPLSITVFKKKYLLKI